MTKVESLPANKLNKYGITDVTKIIYNPSYETLFVEEMSPNLTGFEKGFVLS